MIVPAMGEPPPATVVLQAVRALAQGLPIGIPTDTVYGLAVDPFRAGATDRIFAAKRRPRDVSLPLLVSGIEQALSVATAVPAPALELMARYWPGPLTIVIPARPGLAADLGDDEVTVGVRAPDHPVPLALCAAVGPLATTSANRHGEPPLTTAAAVEAAMDRSDQQLAEIRARLDAMGAPKVAGSKKTPARKAKAAPATRAPAKAKARAAPRKPAAPEEQVFDYEQEPAPPAVLLNRRRPGARPRGSGPLAGA